VPATGTRLATLAEGIANNALLIARGATEIAELDNPNVELGMLLASPGLRQEQVLLADMEREVA